MKLRYLSLFSGIEAFSVAVAPLGWECVGVAEIEPAPCKVLAHHFPHVPNLGDITKITDEQLAALWPVDLIVFGAPCQDLSVAGKRKGMFNDDGTPTRSGLFFAAMRIADCLCARWVIYENVPGMFSSSGGDDFAAVVGEMAGCGFDTPKSKWKNSGVAVGPNGLVEWITLDAQFVRVESHPRAVPQRRRRVFVVRDSGNWQGRPPLFLESEGMRGNPPPSRRSGQTITADAVSGVEGGGGVAGTRSERTGRSVGAQDAACGHMIPSVEVGRSLLAKANDSLAFDLDSYVSVHPVDTICMSHGQICGALAAQAGMKQQNYIAFHVDTQPDEIEHTSTLTASQHHGVMLRNTHELFEISCGCGWIFVGELSDPCPLCGTIRLGAGRTNDVSTERVEVYSFDSLSSNSMKSSNPNSGCNKVDVAKTIDTSGLTPACNQGGAVALTAPSMQVRRLTPLECERLQGFPDGWTDVPGMSDSLRYKALGNSMAVNCMRHIADRILLTESSTQGNMNE